MTHDQPSLRTGSCFLVVVTILLAVRRSPEIFSHFRSSTSWRQKWWKTKQNENVSTVVKIWKCHVGIEPALFIDRFVVPSSTEQLYRAVVAFVAFRKTSTWQNDSRPACGLDHSWLTPCTEKLRFMLVEATGVYAHDIWRRDARDYTRLRQSKLDVVWLGPKGGDSMSMHDPKKRNEKQKVGKCKEYSVNLEKTYRSISRQHSKQAHLI